MPIVAKLTSRHSTEFSINSGSLFDVRNPIHLAPFSMFPTSIILYLLGYRSAVKNCIIYRLTETIVAQIPYAARTRSCLTYKEIIFVTKPVSLSNPLSHPVIAESARPLRAAKRLVLMPAIQSDRSWLIVTRRFGSIFRKSLLKR